MCIEKKQILFKQALCFTLSSHVILNGSDSENEITFYYKIPHLK